MFSWWLNWETCCGPKICVREANIFLTGGKNNFCFRAARFVSATDVSRVAKLGNICLDNNVSAAMFSSLARPLLDGNTELARVVDVMMTRAKRIYILIIKVNKLFSFFSSRCFLKEIENMFSVFLSSFSINLLAFYHE